VLPRTQEAEEDKKDQKQRETDAQDAPGKHTHAHELFGSKEMGILFVVVGTHQKVPRRVAKDTEEEKKEKKKGDVHDAPGKHQVECMRIHARP
jgi:hypothetical protein